MSNFLAISGHKNREFWVSHIIILLATIFGVYLAASAGLKTAVEFELIRSDRNSYYMRTALLEEVRDNVETFETWGKEYRSGQANKFMSKSEDFLLDNFIWLTMQNSAGTFEIPSSVLTSIRRYYNATNRTIKKMTSRQGAAKEVDKMLQDSKTFRTTTLQALEIDIKRLQQKLQKQGFEL